MLTLNFLAFIILHFSEFAFRSPAMWVVWHWLQFHLFFRFEFCCMLLWRCVYAVSMLGMSEAHQDNKMVLALFRVDSPLLLLPRRNYRAADSRSYLWGNGKRDLQSPDKRLNSLWGLSQLYNMVSCHFTMSHKSLSVANYFLSSDSTSCTSVWRVLSSCWGI